MRKPSLFVLLVVAAVLPRAAQAYPQWQFSSGTSRCNQCHFSPAGGGLITNYGRDAAGEELSTWQGNGGFLNGAVELPSWLALGLDARGAFVRQANGSPEGTQTAVFPMQADLYGRLAFLDQFSLAFTVGYRGQARTSPGTLGDNNYAPAGANRFVSREHYLMWRSGAMGPYVRAGRFFAPYGLRLAEHTLYARRDNGFNLLYETYGVSGGFVQNEWELHVTAFAPDLVRSFGTHDKGVAAMYERRLADAYSVGVDTRLGFADDANRYGGGFFGKAYNAALRTLFSAQLDLIHLKGATGDGANQLVVFAGPTFFPVRGLWLSGYFEHNQTDIRVKGTATEAFDGQLNWFPYPHLELVILGRVQAPQQQQSVKTLMIQVHYYL